METIIKHYPNNITVEITYNEPSEEAIKRYAKEIKKIIDGKMIAG